METRQHIETSQTIASIMRPAREQVSQYARQAIAAFSTPHRPDFESLAEVVNSIACLPWVGSAIQIRLANRLGAAYDVTWPFAADSTPNRWSVDILRQSAQFAHAEVLVARIEDPAEQVLRMVIETIAGSACFSMPVYHTEGMSPYISYEECEVCDSPPNWQVIIGQACTGAPQARHAQVGALMANDWFNDGVKRYGDSGRTLLPPAST